MPFFVLLALIAAGCVNQDDQESNAPSETVILEEGPVDGMFIHLSSGYENPKRVLMALTLANKVNETNDVTLFCDIEGVRLLTKDAKDIQMEGYMTLQAALDSLVNAGVPIMACPMCMKAAGISKEMLRDGVAVATVEGFFNFTEGRILSLDY